MTMSMALWVLRQEYKAASWFFDYNDPDPEHLSEEEAMAFVFIAGGAAVQSAPLAMTPYYSIYRVSSSMQWVVDDLAYSAANRGAVMGVHNYSPRMLAFAKRSIGRRLAVKVGARFVPVLGWGLLVYDSWTVGKWIGEKLFVDS
jgi:hypothetical protein